MVTVSLLLLIFLSSTCSTKIHNHMTDDELRLIFRTTRHELPDYEVVTISHHFHKRSTDNTQVIKLRAFGRSVELYLNPNEGLLAANTTPVWTVMPDNGSAYGLKYRKIRDAFRGIGEVHHDVTTNSAIVLQKAVNGKLQIFGKILTDFIVHPVPFRLRYRFNRRKRDNNGTDFSSVHDVTQSDYHIIYRRPESTEKVTQNGIRLVTRDRKPLSNLTISRSKRSIPDVIYPEILVIMDYSLYSTLDKDYNSAITYLLSFWNAVDLKYRTMNEPQIRLNIAGFIISIREGGTPYLENHRRDVSELDSDEALTDMSKYFYHETRFPFELYDMAVALTSLDMCNIVGNHVCDTSTLGYAYEAGACNRSSIDRNTEAVGIVEDNGGYSAILPAAHEVAHLLGVPHDGAIETLDCPGYDGYIMTGAVTFGVTNFHWSNCSKKAFREFFNSDDAYCLLNVPKESAPLPRLLPGKLTTLDEQCKKVYGGKACNYDSSVCTQLECYVPKGNGYCKAVAGAAEGSYCGDGMHCISGYCIAENATTIPELTTTEKPIFPTFHRPTFQPSTWNSPLKKKTYS